MEAIQAISSGSCNMIIYSGIQGPTLLPLQKKPHKACIYQHSHLAQHAKYPASMEQLWHPICASAVVWSLSSQICPNKAV